MSAGLPGGAPAWHGGAMRWILVAAVLMLPGTASAHWEYTRWGMSEAQVVQASRGAVRALPREARRAVERARMEYRAEGSLALPGLRLQLAFAFDLRSGGLVCVSYRAEPREAQALRAHLVRRFGEPQERGGVPETGEETYGWSRPDEIDLNIAPNRAAVALHCMRGT